MASGNFYGNSSVNTNLYVDWESTSNNSTNTSSVTVRLYMKHWRLSATALNGSYISIGGNSAAYNASISQNTSPVSQMTTLLGTRTVTVNHNGDGTGSCKITCTFVLNGTLSGQSVKTITASQTVNLDRIPRSSNITKITNALGTTISSINSGADIRVYWTPASSAFKYRVQCVVPGGSTYTYPSISTFYSPNSTSQTYYSITTAHSWLPSSPSERINVKLYTYDSSGAQIGDVKTGSFALNVPNTTALNPRITSFTATVIDGIGGNYVQGKSKVRLTVNAQKGDDAANIISYTFSGPNITNTASSTSVSTNATNYDLISGLLNYASTGTYSVTVKDSRNRPITAQLANAIRVYPYSAPVVSSMSVQRCTSNGTPDANGTYAYVTVNSAYSSINGQNKLTVKLSSSLDNYATVTMVQNEGTIDTYSGVYGDGSFSIGSTYTIRATIQDKSYGNTVTQSATLATATRPLNILPTGDGVAIGKMAEINNLFDVGWDTLCREDLYVGATKTLANKISGIAKCATRMTSGDLNALYAPGVYTVTSGVINIPASAAFTVVIFPYSISSLQESENAYMVQMAISAGSYTSNLFYIRHNYGNSQWTSWTRIADSTLLSDYLPLSGGTITGTLRLNNYLSFPSNGAAINVSNDLMNSGSTYGRTIEMGNENGTGDQYYLQVDSNHNLKLGTRLNNLSSITWQGITSSQFRHGYCTLNTSSAVTVSFTSSFSGIPQVVLTPYTSSGGVIATKVRSITSSGFSAIIGGSGFSDIRCEYIAIYN